MKTVSLSHDYDAPPERLWHLVTDLDALAEVNRPRITMTGLPSGRIHTGMDLSVMVSVFGLPAQPYRMQVVLCDDAAMRFRSSEHGAGVDRWDHALQVSPVGQGCRVTEQITLSAGWKTALFALWARYLYTARHKARLRLLSQEAAP